MTPPIISTQKIVVLLLVMLIGTSHSSHPKPVPLRGYTCKKNAQRPCSLCPPGFYCSDKDTMYPCGRIDVYCPLGSVKPTPVSKGYFTTPENVDEDKKDSEEQCQPGYYCAGGQKHPCPKGYYCPTKSMATPIECGHSTVFCTEESFKPTRVLKGFFSVGGTNTTRYGQEPAPEGLCFAFAHFRCDLFSCLFHTLDRWPTQDILLVTALSSHVAKATMDMAC